MCPHVFMSLCVTVVKDLVLIPVHTKPEDSQKELDELHDVVDAVRKKWKTNVGLIVTNTGVNVDRCVFLQTADMLQLFFRFSFYNFMF